MGDIKAVHVNSIYTPLPGLLPLHSSPDIPSLSQAPVWGSDQRSRACLSLGQMLGPVRQCRMRCTQVYPPSSLAPRPSVGSGIYDNIHMPPPLGIPK